MKKNIFILSAIAILAGACVAGVCLFSCKQNTDGTPADPIVNDSTAVAGSIVFFNIDRVMAEYDMANDLRAVVETKVNSIKAEITRRENKLTRDLNDFNNKLEKGLLTNSVAQAQQQKLQQQQQSYQKYVMEKQQEMAEEQTVMLNNIMNAINEYIVEYNKDKQFSLILTTSGDLLTAPVVIGDSALDITEEVLKGLNEAYVRDKDKVNEDE